MYALIYKSGMCLGIFSSKRIMQAVIEEIIRGDYQKTGVYGNFNFRYIKFNADEPWVVREDKVDSCEAGALFSFSTMHTEKFVHKVQTDWNTGKVLDMDAKSTTNI